MLRSCTGTGRFVLMVIFSLLALMLMIWLFHTTSKHGITSSRENGNLSFLQMISSDSYGDGPIVWTYSSSSPKENDFCNGIEKLEASADFYLHQLQSVLGRILLYTHNPSYDHISGVIHQTKNYQPHIFRTIHSFLKEHREVNLIDVGANIGVISLQAAVMGRKVIAIDAVKSNIQHICASALKNDVCGRINLIYNAVSNIHTNISFAMAKNGEYGVGFMDEINLRKTKLKLSNKKFKFDTQNMLNINTVLLDDLLDLPNINDFKTVFIKIDVEGSEDKVLLGARELFRKLNVRGVLMEWKWVMKQQESKHAVLLFMTEFGFEPHEIVKSSIGRKLNGTTMKDLDVIWLPNQ